jgi:outer membrane protein OmpA-like peptidoglycan-associated protein
MATDQINELVKFVLKIKSDQTTHEIERYSLNLKIHLQKVEIDKKDDKLYEERKRNREFAIENGGLKKELELLKKEHKKTKTSLRETKEALEKSQEVCKNNDIYFNHKRQKLRESHRELKESLNETNEALLENNVKKILRMLEDFSKKN